MPVLPRPQPTTSPGRRPRLDRSSERALGAPPAAGAAPTLLQLSTADMVVEALRPRAGTPRTSDAAARSVTTQGSLRKALADGHCLFETWQMGRSVLGLSSCSKFECRKTTAGWMLQNAAKIINGMTLRFWVRVECEDGHISEAAKHETYEEYCRKMGSSTRFGGLPEILAFTEQDGLNAWVWTPARGRRGWYERVTKVDVVQGAKTSTSAAIVQGITMTYWCPMAPSLTRTTWLPPSTARRPTPTTQPPPPSPTANMNLILLLHLYRLELAAARQWPAHRLSAHPAACDAAMHVRQGRTVKKS